MRLLNKLLLSINVWTIIVSMFFVWVGFSGLGAVMLGPKDTDRVFLYFFQLVLVSFLGASIIIKILCKVLSLKISFHHLNFSLSWIFILALGSLFFTCSFVKTPLFNFEFFAGVFALSLVPASLFRILINGAISIFTDSNDTVSIIIESNESKML